jgi:hypothetical protein
MIPSPAILSRLPAWIPFYLHISIVYLPNKISHPNPTLKKPGCGLAQVLYCLYMDISLEFKLRLWIEVLFFSYLFY